MSAHWTQEIAKSLASGRPSSGLEQHLDALLLWLSNPDNPKAAALDKAVARNRLERRRATLRAYQLLDRWLFATDRPPSPQTLGLRQDADPRLAKQRYRRLIQVYHPDRHPDSTAWATQHTEQINLAYDSFRRPPTKGRRPQAASPATDNAHAGPETDSPGERPGYGIAWLLSWIDGDAWRGLIAHPGARRWAGGILILVLMATISASLLHEEPKPRPRIIHHPLGQIDDRPRTVDMEPGIETEPTTPPQTPSESAAIAANETRDPAEPPTPVVVATNEPSQDPDRTLILARTHSQDVRVRDIEPQEETEPRQDRAVAHAKTAQDPTSEAERSATAEPSGSEAHPETQPIDPSNPIEARTEAETRVEPVVPEEPSESPDSEPPNTQPPQSANDDLPAPASQLAPNPVDRPYLARLAPERPRAPQPEPDTPPRASPDLLQPELQIPAAAAPAPPTPPQAPNQPLQLGAATATIGAIPGTDPDAVVCRQAPALMRRFQQAYQSGSLDGLMALYSPLAKENELGTWFAIRQTYRQWFASTGARRIDFEQLQVKPTANGRRCAAIAIFKVVYLDPDSKVAQRDGVIEILLEPKGQDLRILRMRY